MQYDYIQSLPMGVGGIPGTFPTGAVRDWLLEWSSSFAWSRTIVNDLFRWYKEAVQVEKLASWLPGSAGGNKTKTVEYIHEKTGIALPQIRSFLVALVTLSKKGEIDNKWLSIEKATSSDYISKISDFTTSYVKYVKWIGIAGVGVAALYFLSPIIKATFRKRKIKARRQ
jgi:hypothetical protein